MLNLTGQRIFITGGSRGIGRAAALLAAEAGAAHRHWLCTRPAAALATVKQIEALGRKAVAVQADVTKQKSGIKGAIDRAAAAPGGLNGQTGSFLRGNF